MSNRFHNKWHRKNHHTYGNASNPDAAHDPIASSEQPFLGDFSLQGALCAVAPMSAYAIYAYSNFTGICAFGGNKGIQAKAFNYAGAQSIGIQVDSQNIAISAYAPNIGINTYSLTHGTSTYGVGRGSYVGSHVKGIEVAAGSIGLEAYSPNKAISANGGLMGAEIYSQRRAISAYGSYIGAEVASPQVAISAYSPKIAIRAYAPNYYQNTDGVRAMDVRGFSYFDGDVHITGSLTANGYISYLDTLVTVTSATYIENKGTGPALTVIQRGIEPIAHFFDDGNSALYIDGKTDTPGYVGINTSTPNERLTIVGNISGYSDHVSFNNSRASGTWSLSEGTSRATGNISHAEGSSTLASGEISHAEGFTTIASASASHAEGSWTRASGEGSHAEGNQTTASGQHTHAEGGGTVASGVRSHAEGFRTISSGNSTHAEGIQTTASGYSSHAEGELTVASGAVSHAEGRSSLASGIRSHAQNDNTVASGQASHAAGTQTVAAGNNATSIGYQTSALTEHSFAGGLNSIVKDRFLGFAFGQINKVTQDGSVALGGANLLASGPRACAIGNNGSIASGYESHTEGIRTGTGNRVPFESYDPVTKTFTFSPTNSAIFFGEFFGNLQVTLRGCITGGGTGSFHEGNFFDIQVQPNSIAARTPFNTLSALGVYPLSGGEITWSIGSGKGWIQNGSGWESHAEGYESVASGFRCSHAEGLQTLASGDGGSHSEGNNTTASGRWGSHAEGYYTIASGEYGAHSEGQNTMASGTASHAEGQNTTASGTASHAEGNVTIASGTASHAEGYITVASGIYGHAEGVNTIALSAAHAEGSNTQARGEGSHAEGHRTVASGARSHAEGLLTVSSGNSTHAEGIQTSATGYASHSEGELTTASGARSHAAGTRATASKDNSYIWSGDTTLGTNVQTTLDRQYMINAPSGVYIPRGMVGIGTGTDYYNFDGGSFYPLTVNGPISSKGLRLWNTSQISFGDYSINNDIAYIGLQFDNPDYGRLVITTADNQAEPIVFRQFDYSNSTQYNRLVIGQSGNIGIGTGALTSIESFNTNLAVYGTLSSYSAYVGDKLYFGSGLNPDVNLYRAYGNTLETDDNLIVSEQLSAKALQQGLILAANANTYIIPLSAEAYQVYPITTSTVIGFSGMQPGRTTNVLLSSYVGTAQAIGPDPRFIYLDGRPTSLPAGKVLLFEVISFGTTLSSVVIKSKIQP